MNKYHEIEHIIREQYEKNPEAVKRFVIDILPSVVESVNIDPNNPEIQEIINHVNHLPNVNNKITGGNPEHTWNLGSVIGLITIALVIGVISWKRLTNNNEEKKDKNGVNEKDNKYNNSPNIHFDKHWLLSEKYPNSAIFVRGDPYEMVKPNSINKKSTMDVSDPEYEKPYKSDRNSYLDLNMERSWEINNISDEEKKDIFEKLVSVKGLLNKSILHSPNLKILYYKPNEEDSNLFIGSEYYSDEEGGVTDEELAELKYKLFDWFI